MREPPLANAMPWTLVASLWLYPALVVAGPPAPSLGHETGLGPVDYHGEFPTYFQSEFEQTVVSSLERATGAPIRMQGQGCAQFECVRQAAEKGDVGVIIMSRLLRDNRDFQVEFVAHAVADGRVLGRTTVECSICGQQELLDAIPAKLTELDAKIAQALAAQTWPPQLTVSGSPKHARLALDGVTIRPGQASLDVVPGGHELEITAEGYATQLHRWTAVEGVEQRIEYTLTRVAVDRELLIGGWVAVSLGAVGAGVG
ncbi:hypothetical protein, partial [Enhygromyxa salina]|uniref:hypothetical protein n=1 Tax=Enhygromyxa salina TaxID=215803 RepID=UPI002467BF9E